MEWSLHVPHTQVTRQRVDRRWVIRTCNMTMEATASRHRVLYLGRLGVAVKASTSSPLPLRFGVFELDPRAGELRKKGMKIRLHGQPVEILVLLLQHPGETVTREELQKKLWPADTFVDFERGLNNAMNRLRAALDDDAETPRFVETLPRRGYRFIGSVNGLEQTPAAEASPPVTPGPMLRFSAFAAMAAIAVAAVLVGVNVRGWRDRLFPRHTNPPVEALAVLPLANLSGDPEQEYFADGMTEALITELGKVSKPSVISRQSIMQYKGSKKPLQEIARELNVDAVLEGAVERSGDRVRVSVHLERVSPESQVWANEYSSNIGDVMGLEDDIARAISDEIQVRLTLDERIRFANRRPVKPEAHDDFLRAEFLVEKRNERDLQAGITYFKKAIENDPAYARAYAGLAWALVNLAHLGTHRTKDILPQARAAADEALELDPSMDEAHVSRAMVLLLEWNWFEAEKEHRLALTLAPNSWDAHSSYAWYLLNLGRFDEARAQIKYAEELDPVSPISRTLLAYVDLLSGQTDLAIEEFKNSNWDLGLGFAYGVKKMYPDADAAFQRVASQWGREPVVVANLAWVYGLAGRKHDAQKLIDELNEVARHRYVAPALFMNAYLGLGYKETALTWMERGIEEHDPGLIGSRVYPILDPLRSEPRFQAALRRMNFPQ
jgi:TolB-like protein/DNA-binding winged helix-turn-helix (wHTH) protein/Flp pilus assembly protein TadD